MKKSELIKALQQLPNDGQVLFYNMGDGFYYESYYDSNDQVVGLISYDKNHDMNQRGEIYEFCTLLEEAPILGIKLDPVTEELK